MFRLLARATELAREGRRVLQLAVGDTAGFTNHELVRIVREESRRPELGYAPSAGLPDLREAFSARYTAEKGVAFGPESVVVAPASALVSEVLAVVCDPGDRVLVPDPGYPTYRLACGLNALEAVPYDLLEERQWAPDVGRFLALLDRRRPKVAILNVPSNPLGQTIAQEQLSAMVEALAARGILCVFDETYKRLVYEGEQPVVPPSEWIVYLYSMSKDAAAPGLRIGCVVGDPLLVERVVDFNALFFSSLPPLLQRVAARYLTEDVDFAATLRAEVPRRILRVAEILERSETLRHVRPHAAIYVFVDVSRTGVDSEELAAGLLEERGVGVCPGTAFGRRGFRYVRLALTGDEAELEEGCAVLADYADRLGRRDGQLAARAVAVPS